tara:strand:- start:136 stop:1776 length:1641 start_codon:yes stop_codon:yes gene_type:complete
MSSEDLESLIVSDESLLDPSVDTSRLRRTTDTRQELLGDLQPGLQYDPTLQSTYSDLLRYFSGDLDIAPAPVSTVTTPTVGSPTDGGSGGGETIETGSGGQATITDPTITSPTIQPGDPSDMLPQISSILDNSKNTTISPTTQPVDPSGMLPQVSGTTPSYVDPIMDSNLMAIRQQQNLEAQDVDAQGNLLQTGIDKIKSITSDFDPVTAAAKLAINTYVGKPISFVVDALQALPKSESQKEYEGYTDAQKGVIDEAYGAGGVMEGYNAVSTFGDGPLDTMTDRYNTRVSNGIIDATTTDLANKINALGGNVDNFEDGGDGGDDRDTFGGVPGVPDAIGGNISKGYSYADTPGGGGDPDPSGPSTDDFADDFDDGTMTGTAATTTGGDPVGGFFDAVDKAAADARSDAMGGDNTGFSGDTGVGQDAGTSGGTGGRRGGAGGNGGGGGGKIVCTMMNESYGFGSFRNKIWLKHSKDLAPEYQKGYHKIFLPLVKLSKTNKLLKKTLEHIAIHRTIDIRQESRGKVHLLGRVYRKILEPICYWVGKHG